MPPFPLRIAKYIVFWDADKYLTDDTLSTNNQWNRTCGIKLVCTETYHPTALPVLGPHANNPTINNNNNNPNNKQFLDGSIQLHTACTKCGYHDQPDNCGYLSRSRELQQETFTKYHNLGYQVAMHANGDGAIEVALDLIENVTTAHRRPDHRHRIEHCQLAHIEQLDRIKHLQSYANFFINHVYYWGERHFERFLGPERANRINPLASAAERQVSIKSVSDSLLR
jgi:predicted amidohydrolase YtcJ